MKYIFIIVLAFMFSERSVSAQNEYIFHFENEAFVHFENKKLFKKNESNNLFFKYENQKAIKFREIEGKLISYKEFQDKTKRMNFENRYKDLNILMYCGSQKSGLLYKVEPVWTVQESIID